MEQEEALFPNDKGNMQSFEDYLKQRTSIEANNIFGAIVSIVDADGPVYTQSAGRIAYENDSVLPIDATLRVYSFTKLITTIAALQCIERGQIHLDDYVDIILSELKQPLVIAPDCQDDNDFSLKASKGKITLRHLLTHTSGIGYDALHPLLRQWRATRGEKPQTMCGDVIKAYSTPLLFEPGQSWAYGGGLDWVGILIERLNKQTLGSYMAENIFGPLGMTSTTFHPRDRPELMAKVMDTILRTPEGVLVRIPPMYSDDAETDAGGIGLFSSLTDFTKIIEDLLRDEPKLLKPSTRDQMFIPQFSPSGPQAEGMSAMSDVYGNLTGSEATFGKVAFGLGGLITLEDTPHLPKGTLSWGGLPNLFWCLNRSRRKGAALALQMMPPNDAACTSLIAALASHTWSQKAAKPA